MVITCVEICVHCAGCAFFFPSHRFAGWIYTNRDNTAHFVRTCNFSGLCAGVLFLVRCRFGLFVSCGVIVMVGRRKKRKSCVHTILQDETCIWAREAINLWVLVFSRYRETHRQTKQHKNLVVQKAQNDDSESVFAGDRRTWMDEGLQYTTQDTYIIWMVHFGGRLRLKRCTYDRQKKYSLKQTRNSHRSGRR